jgi:hypothetical protein
MGVDTGVIERAASLADRYAEDGVILLEQALTQQDLSRVRDVFDYGRAHPSAGAQLAYPESGATFYIDTFNAANWPEYRPAFADTVVPDIVAALWGADDVWFFYEQLFLKEGGEARRTPWHQDSSYLPVAGDHVAVVWINFDPLDAGESLEFVRGSHRGPTFSTSRFDPGDDTLPIVESDMRPRLPDVEATRGEWDIVSWPIEPGDIVVFHAGALHGGAPMRPDGRRRTVSLRYFGADAVFAPPPLADARREASPGAADDPEQAGLAAVFGSLEPGAPFRHPMFAQVRPRPTG